MENLFFLLDFSLCPAFLPLGEEQQSNQKQKKITEEFHFAIKIIIELGFQI